MRIQELERKTGLDRATIRYYEREGLISPSRTENSYREYSEADVQHLLKIKLLRQLAFPVEKIKALQQGSASVSEAMEEQIYVLERKSQTLKSAGEVCRKISTAGVDYSGMDAVFYLQMLSETAAKQPFREEIEQEFHPVRRYIARTLDWALVILLLNWLLYCVIRIRPARDIYSYLIVAAGLLVSIFTEASLVHFFGTTPGKWIMGISVASVNGGRLTWEDSLWRARLVTHYGVGFRIPIWQWIRLYLGYQSHAEGKQMEWEEDSELHYRNWNHLRLIAVVLIYCLITVGLSTIVLDYSNFPKNRGSQLTVSEFAQNYNGYAQEVSLLDLASREPLLEKDGTWESIVRYADGTRREDPVFTCDENGFIQKIELSGKSERIMEICKLFTKALVGAQPHLDAMGMAKYNARYEVDNQLEIPLREGEIAGEFCAENLLISWIYEPLFDQLTYTIKLPE